MSVFLFSLYFYDLCPLKRLCRRVYIKKTARVGFTSLLLLLLLFSKYCRRMIRVAI